mmetsp:Transcript_107240/g.169334  ORF Transcript_107240/g.169334 Transcript_107240/m.169334 type:complete len:146 (+) Transcript_107240:62-499(+)|eukprot:CAMPEP_0169246612 /NCGR_PEP_ID=MMETSP1016-20121227/34830_1 /TAXON_ID=342587 /ORGANISM="Karlodinium micrum, Strain CCMP2283" /LENGTH=145 /DNA_ID=CAMNT_0009327209 /DNA_START=57 /DNA_END=494 /DNA_ORIENTATION=-
MLSIGISVLVLPVASAVIVHIEKDPTSGEPPVDAVGKCFNALNRDGFNAFVTGSDVVVYDPDAPCPGGGSFIHYAGREFVPMTAGAGPTVHTYHAGHFKPKFGIVAAQSVGKCSDIFNLDSPGENEITWKVAAGYRGGSCGPKEL